MTRPPTATTQPFDRYSPQLSLFSSLSLSLSLSALPLLSWLPPDSSLLRATHSPS
jgi:hypothetical protein